VAILDGRVPSPSAGRAGRVPSPSAGSAGRGGRTISPNNIPYQIDDATAIAIFSTIDNKYRKGYRIFDTERLNVLRLNRNNQITDTGFCDLNNIIQLYEQTYQKFIDDVVLRRIFYEKASSGRPPRQLLTGLDWGDAIIELINLVDIFKRDLQTSISVHTQPEILKKECQTFPVNRCRSPCTVNRPFFRKSYCDLN
jgi:hypothetical protein